MNYEEISDNEINEMVADLMGGYAGNVHGSESKVKVNDAETNGLFYMEVDYCNNPSDAWPIIFSSRTMLNPYCADELWKAEVPCGFDGFVKEYATCYHRNPLRAAMIVFLMMQERTCQKP